VNIEITMSVDRVLDFGDCQAAVGDLPAVFSELADMHDSEAKTIGERLEDELQNAFCRAKSGDPVYITDAGAV
jgi:hypothetical protein